MRRYRVELVCESGEDEPEEAVLRTSTDAARLLATFFKGADREKFLVVLLDAKHRAIGVNTVSIGSLTAAIVTGAGGVQGGRGRERGGAAPGSQPPERGSGPERRGRRSDEAP